MMAEQSVQDEAPPEPCLVYTHVPGTGALAAVANLAGLMAATSLNNLPGTFRRASAF